MQALLQLFSGQLSVISHQSSEPEHHAPVPNPQSPVTNPQSPTLLFIDQFEETFTLADAAERAAFLDAVHELIGQPNLRILLTVRADFYAEMMAMGDLWEDVQARRLELTPLGEDELWTAIVEPAARVGVEVEDALATALIADARGEAGVLPLVQETLVRLWDKVEGRQLGRSAYRQMADGGRSGIQVAINDHANDIYHTLPAADRSIARRIFLRLIQFGEGRADTRRQQTVSELRAGGDDPVRFDETLRALVDGRLLTTSGEEGDPNRRVDISHEALIGGWALLQGWISEMRVAESTRRRLEDKVTEWLRLDKSGGLLDEYEVLEVEAWLSSDYSSELRYRQELIDLKDASRAALASAEAEKAEAEQTRRRAQIFAGGLVLAALAIALVGWFWWQAIGSESRAVAAADAAKQSEGAAISAKATAEVAATAESVQRQAADTARTQAETSAQEARIAEATAVAAKTEIETLNRGVRATQLTATGLYASGMSANSVEMPAALLLAVEGLRAQSDYTTTVLIEPPSLDLPSPLTHTQVVSAPVVAIAQENVHRLLQQMGHWATPLMLRDNPPSDDGIVEFDVLGSNPGALGYIISMSANGHWLAGARDDGTIQLWSIIHPTNPVIELAGHTTAVSALAYSTNGTLLASASEDGVVLLWDLDSDWPEPTELGKHRRSVNALAFDPLGNWVASGSDDGSVRLWSLKRDTAPHTLLEDDSSVRSVQFSHNGKWLAHGSQAGIIYLHSLDDTAAQPLILSGHEESVEVVLFSPNGRWLASAARDNTVHLRDMADPQAQPLILPGGYAAANTLAFSPDSRWLAAALRGSGAALWDLRDPTAEHRQLQEHYDVVTAVAFSPDSRWLATGSGDYDIRLWSVNEPTDASVVLDGHDNGIQSVVFSADGRWLASIASDDTVRLWTWRVSDLIEIACTEAGRNFTYWEWIAHFTGNQYRQTCPQWPIHPSVLEEEYNLLVGFAENGARESALRIFRQTLDLAEQAGTLSYWLDLCKIGSRFNFQDEALPACKKAFAQAQLLPSSRTAEGTLPPSSVQIWSFSGTVGQTITVTINVDIGDIDPALSLYDSQWELLVETPFERISSFSLPEDGTYWVAAHNEQTYGSGEPYTLSVEVSEVLSD